MIRQQPVSVHPTQTQTPETVHEPRTTLMGEAFLHYLDGHEPHPTRRDVLLKAFGELTTEEALQRTVDFAARERPLPLEELPPIVHAWLVTGEETFVSTYRSVRPSRRNGAAQNNLVLTGA